MDHGCRCATEKLGMFLIIESYSQKTTLLTEQPALPIYKQLSQIYKLYVASKLLTPGNLELRPTKKNEFLVKTAEFHQTSFMKRNANFAEVHDSKKIQKNTRPQSARCFP